MNNDIKSQRMSSNKKIKNCYWIVVAAPSFGGFPTIKMTILSPVEEEEEEIMFPCQQVVALIYQLTVDKIMASAYGQTSATDSATEEEEECALDEVDLLDVLNKETRVEDEIELQEEESGDSDSADLPESSDLAEAANNCVLGPLCRYVLLSNTMKRAVEVQKLHFMPGEGGDDVAEMRFSKLYPALAREAKLFFMNEDHELSDSYYHERLVWFEDEGASDFEEDTENIAPGIRKLHMQHFELARDESPQERLCYKEDASHFHINSSHLFFNHSLERNKSKKIKEQ